MHYLNISFSHKNSDLKVREKLSLPTDDMKKETLAKLNENQAINESIVLSTCNRMEIFSSCKDTVEATKHALKVLSENSGISVEELEGRADIFDDSSAIHHLFSVASSLDSMVVGETQIAGQIKDAFRFSSDHKFGGKKISRAVHSAFKCAAKVRNATDISSKPVSIASVAVSKLKSVLDDMSGKKALIIGVGEMSEITAKHLATTGADVFIMNRTKHKAEALADTCGAKVIEFEALKDAVNDFEILFTATSADEAIITDDIIKSCDFDRHWFDMAMPRDIDYHKGERINLYQIDDLKNIVSENIGLREDSARAAHSVIGRATVEFFELLNTLDIEPIIKDIYQKASLAAKEETQRVMKKGFIPKEYEEQVLKMNEQVLKRFLHDLTTNMRNVSEDSKADMISGAAHFLVNNNAQIEEFKSKHGLKG